MNYQWPPRWRPRHRSMRSPPYERFPAPRKESQVEHAQLYLPFTINFIIAK